MAVGEKYTLALASLAAFDTCAAALHIILVMHLEYTVAQS